MSTTNTEIPAVSDRLLSAAEAAAIYGIHPKTFKRLVDEGKAPADVKWPGSERRWRLSDLQNHIRSLDTVAK